MATSSELIGYNDITLWAGECLLEDIHERAPDWDQRPDGERADMYYEWEGTVGRIQGTIDDDRDGLLTAEQRVRLRALARRIVASRKLILQMGLVYPDLGHVLADAPMSASSTTAGPSTARPAACERSTSSGIRRSPPRASGGRFRPNGNGPSSCSGKWRGWRSKAS